MNVFTVRFKITKDGQTGEYRVRPLPADPAVALAAWRVSPADGPNEYDVRLSPEGHWHCECLGHLSYGRCKHVATLRAFVQWPLLLELKKSERIGNRPKWEET